MCQSNAYVLRNGEKELFMEDVSEVIPQDKGWTLVGMLGEKKFVEASIERLALTDHEIVLREN